MKQFTMGVAVVLTTVALLSGCSSREDAYPTQAQNSKAAAKADSMQAERWDFNLPNQEVWKVGYKVQNGTVNNFIWIPTHQNMGTWKQNITDKFIADSAVAGKTPEDLMNQAKQASEARCQHVDWQTLNQSNTQIVYEADTVCGKETQHLVGRIQAGQGGLYSLQYFAVQNILDGHMKQTMLDTIQDAKLVANN